MDSQEECLEIVLDGRSLVNRDGLIVFMYDGGIVNTSYEVEDISFVDHYNWEELDE